MTNATVDGIDIPRVTQWLQDAVPSFAPPLAFELIAGGRSNLTYRVTDTNGAAVVLRRPPLGHVLATAHDMSREYRIISALGDTDVPVAPAIGLCTDEAVNGAPFYVMAFVEGTVVRDRTVAETLTPEQRHAAGMSLVDVLVRIHATDPDAVGLGDLGRREGYIERQLKRWHSQWEQSAYADITTIDEVHKRLAADIPEQGPAAIVHGDYRLDNCMLADDGSIAAVLDWEICTLGDPLADLGLLLVYWTDPGDDFTALPDAATALDGFPRKADLMARYAEQSGRDVSQVAYFVAFGYWKLACILAGVATRYAAGAMGGTDGEGTAAAELFAVQVRLLADSAAAAADRAGR
jgi:aminoglycoside phosphotransferase (APT) family kinase protein